MRTHAETVRARLLARLAAVGLVAGAVAGCADTRLGSDPFYSPFGSRAPEATGSIAPAQAAPTTQVSTQPLPPPYYPPVPVQQSEPRVPTHAAALPPPPASRWPQAASVQAPPAAVTASYPPPRAAAPVSYSPPPANYSSRPVTVAAAPSPGYRPPAAVGMRPVEVTGAVPAGTQSGSDSWAWDGGTPVTVQPGESVEILARRYGVPPDAIIRANNLSDPRAIRPGQRLVIPAYTYRPGDTARSQHTGSITPAAPVPQRAVAPPPVAGVHVVNSGETLTGIARRYGVNRMALASANRLAPDTRLTLGQRLTIPGRGVVPAAAPPQQAVAPSMRPTAVQTQPAAPAPAMPRRAEAKPDPAAKPEVTETAALAKPQVTPAEAKTEPRPQGVAFRWPVRGRVIAGFGSKPGGERNDGINIAVPEGASVKAAEDGIVAYAGSELKGYGNLVLIRHADGWVTAYAHNSEVLVRRGDSVKRGQIISRAGQTGSVTSPQVHFEVRRGSNPVDPMPLMTGG